MRVGCVWLSPGSVSWCPNATFAVVGLVCPSLACLIGVWGFAAHDTEALPDVPVSDPVTPSRAALGALGASRIALLTPYLAAINHSLRASLMARGMDIPVMEIGRAHV